jgi:hypothetical protein
LGNVGIEHLENAMMLDNPRHIPAHKGADHLGRCGFRKYRTAISLIPGQPFQ